MDRVIVSRHPAAVQFIAQEIQTQLRREYAAKGWNFEPEARVAPDGKSVCLRGFDTPGGAQSGAETPIEEVIPVLAEAKADDLRGKVVYGNLPMHLASGAAQVWAVEFAGAPPRGQEYGIAEMRAAGARLTPYVVVAVSPDEPRDELFARIRTGA